MRRHRSFQLEEKYLGTFLLQGWLGGIITGFVYLVAMCYWGNGNEKFIEALFFSHYFSILGTILGVIKSTIMWGAYRLTRIQARAVTRVVLASLGTGLFALATGYFLGSGRTNDLVAWVSTLVVGGLPTAILIGSSIKPWELLTFGSIATGEGRSGSRNVLAILATLPLRFLSLGGLALWILYVVCEGWNNWSSNTLLLSSIPIAYLLFSAYLTFRSPEKFILFVIALVANIPLGIIVFSHYVITPEAYWLSDAPPYAGAICMAFLTAWMVCLAGRLSVPIHRVALPRDHHCLGSRFIEWQERHAW